MGWLTCSFYYLFLTFCFSLGFLGTTFRLFDFLRYIVAIRELVEYGSGCFRDAGANGFFRGVERSNVYRRSCSTLLAAYHAVFSTSIWHYESCDRPLYHPTYRALLVHAFTHPSDFPSPDVPANLTIPYHPSSPSLSLSPFTPSLAPSSTHATLCHSNAYPTLKNRAAGAIIVALVYGYHIVPPGQGRDPLVSLANEGIAQISYAAQPGAFLVDIVPVCEWGFFQLGSCVGL